ncbi:hypothetical protein MAR_031808 [Mya arenaria]|uniref:Uncharacterized protein n=1 Tax=Mya arenaria TaxID=6604 RepID=A0ABY7F7S5_MYAAR|nr:hypothetical protein MAR_031808 [Mya arenaria]
MESPVAQKDNTVQWHVSVTMAIYVTNLRDESDGALRRRANSDDRVIKKWAGSSMDSYNQPGNKLEVHCDDHQELALHLILFS